MSVINTGLAVGESLEIQVGSYRHKLRIVDVIASEDRRIRRSLKGLLVTDIATAQEVFAKIGKLDRIDLILPVDSSKAEVHSDASNRRFRPARASKARMPAAARS